MAKVVRFILLAWLVSLVIGFAESALAGSYSVTGVCIFQTNGTCESGSSITLSGSSPVELCGKIGAREGYEYTDTFTSHPTWYTRVCTVRKVGSEYQTCTIVAQDTGLCQRGRSLTTVSGGSTCWEAQESFGYTDSPPGGCEPCLSPEVWHPDTMQCGAPECEAGEVWDVTLNACRAECDSDDFFHYSSASCKAKCPSGLSSPYILMSNKSTIGQLVTSTINGCPVERHFQCVTETLPDAYYTGTDFTGKVCMHWWEYKAPVEDYAEYDVVTQEEWEAATGSSGYYEGDDHEPNLVGFESIENLNIDFSSLGGDIAINIEASHFLCLGGVYRLVTTINGVPDEVEFLGACPSVDQEFTAPGPSQNEFEARLEAKVDAVKETGEETKTLLQAVNDLADQIKAQTQAIGVSMGVLDGEGGESEPGEFAGPEVGAEYETQYPGGLDAVVQEAQDGLTGVGALETWMQGLVPILPEPDAACPSWTFRPPMIGGADVVFEPDCRVWDWLKALFYVGTVAACYGIVLGRRA